MIDQIQAEEKFTAIARLKTSLEDNFLALGQLLADVKRFKLYRIKGYKSFKDFVEDEYSLGGTMAGKLIGIHELYLKELEIDDQKLKEVGYARLDLIKPVVKQMDYDLREEWVEKARTLSAEDLREEVKEVKAKLKDKGQTPKEMFVDQFKMRLMEVLNCQNSELFYRLALYFMDADMEQVKNQIKQNQRRFEEDRS